MLNTTRVVVAGIHILVATVVFVAGEQIYNAYHAAIARAGRDVYNAQGALVEHAAQTFDVVRRALDSAAELRDSVNSGLHADPDAMHDLLKVIQGRSPVFSALGWTDAKGNRLYSSVFR